MANTLFQCLAHGVFESQDGDERRCPKCKTVCVRAQPKVLDVEFTNRCSAKCVMCPRGQPSFNREIGDMPSDMLYRIAEEIKKWNEKKKKLVKWIWCHMFGESLLHPYAVEFIDVLKDAGPDAVISTNAMPLTEEMSSRLLNSGVHRVILSVDGVTKETYEAIRGLNFNTMKRNVDGFLKIARRRHEEGLRNPQIWIQILRLKENEDEWLKFVRKYTGRPRITAIAKYQDVKGLPNAKVFAKQVERYGGQVDGERHPGWDGADRRRYTCRKPWDRMSIFWNGDVGICCYDANAQVVVGNLRRDSRGKAQSIHGIWLGNAMSAIRTKWNRWQKTKGKEGGLPSLCRDC